MIGGTAIIRTSNWKLTEAAYASHLVTRAHTCPHGAPIKVAVELEFNTAGQDLG